MKLQIIEAFETLEELSYAIKQRELARRKFLEIDDMLRDLQSCIKYKEITDSCYQELIRIRACLERKVTE